LEQIVVRVVGVGGGVTVWVNRAGQIARRRVAVAQRLVAGAADLRDAVRWVARVGDGLAVAGMDAVGIDGQLVPVAVGLGDQPGRPVQYQDPAVVGRQ